MVNALSSGGASSLLASSSTQLNTLRIAERMYTDMRKKTDAITESYAADTQSLQAERGTLTGRQRDLTAVQTAVSNGEQQVSDVRSILLEMRSFINRAEDNPDNRGYYVEQFNARLKEINSIADRYSQTYNLVGRVDPETLEPPAQVVQVSQFGVDATFQGLYLGSSFNLIGTGASEGLSYQNEPSANVMQAVDEPGGEELEGTITHNGTRVQNLVVSDDGSIQFDLDGTTPFTGTVQKGGLGIMPAWYYDDFTDFEGMRQAVRDADRYLNQVSFQLKQIDIEVTPLVDRVQRDLSSVDTDLAEIFAKQQKEVEEIEDETRRQFEAVEQSLSQSAGEITRYKTIMQSIYRGPFTNIEV
ncbi:hypothetical protein [Roseospira visakhapatnamensis]|uniref:Putative nucleic acid-binding Zn-ribbon protein n=1 Tax=Roseospira visakhapatnamensis TaxID=390880 RepID=A0A7W6WBE8_9PROT|nr:hypothetical protein [Roseospira visakhapatnamensis]MBB4267467.1 putative nucleic acid-binding Zn-ribbon protein [Roseospira visakhapatnamensis]